MKHLLFRILMVSCLAAYGQGTKISELPSASSVSGTDIVPIVQSSSNKKATITLIRGFSTYGTATQLLRVNSGATGLEFFTPSWLVGQGGTGLTTVTSNSYLKGNGTSALVPRTYSEVRSDLGLVIGTNVQAYDADLTTWAGITPGTGVATALGVNVGSAGAFVTFNGAGGTPSSLTGTNITGLPLSTGVTGILPVANGGTGLSSLATIVLNSASTSTASGTITLDMNSQVQRMHVGSASFSTAKIIALSNTSNALVFQFTFTVTNVAAVLTMPSDFLMSDTNWDGTDWTPPATGQYEMGGAFDGTNWLVKIIGPFN